MAKYSAANIVSCDDDKLEENKLFLHITAKCLDDTGKYSSDTETVWIDVKNSTLINKRSLNIAPLKTYYIRKGAEDFKTFEKKQRAPIATENENENQTENKNENENENDNENENENDSDQTERYMNIIELAIKENENDIKEQKSKYTVVFNIQYNLDSLLNDGFEQTTYFRKTDVKLGRMNADLFVNTILRRANFSKDQMHSVAVWNEFTKKYVIIAVRNLQTNALEYSRDVLFIKKIIPKDTSKKKQNEKEIVEEISDDEDHDKDTEDKEKKKKKKKKKKPRKKKGKKNRALKYDTIWQKPSSNQEHYESAIAFQFISSYTWYNRIKKHVGDFVPNENNKYLETINPKKPTTSQMKTNLLPQSFDNFSVISISDNDIPALPVKPTETSNKQQTASANKREMQNNMKNNQQAPPPVRSTYVGNEIPYSQKMYPQYNSVNQHHLYSAHPLDINGQFMYHPSEINGSNMWNRQVQQQQNVHGLQNNYNTKINENNNNIKINEKINNKDDTSESNGDTLKKLESDNQWLKSKRNIQTSQHLIQVLIGVQLILDQWDTIGQRALAKIIQMGVPGTLGVMKNFWNRIHHWNQANPSQKILLCDVQQTKLDSISATHFKTATWRQSVKDSKSPMSIAWPKINDPITGLSLDTSASQTNILTQAYIAKMKPEIIARIKTYKAWSAFKK